MEQQGYSKFLGPPQAPFAGKEHGLPIVGHSDWRRELRRTILSRVVPRLSDMGRQADAAAEPAAAALSLTEAQVVRFV